MSYDAMKQKFIREVETVIDSRRKKVDDLMAEAAEAEAEEAEARKLLHFLKTGDNGALPKEQAAATLRKPRTYSSTKVTNDQIVGALVSLKSFTMQDAGKLVGMQPNALRHRIQQLESEGRAEMVQNFATTSTGRAAQLWRIVPPSVTPLSSD